MINLLVLGDVMGRPGRCCLKKLKPLQEKYDIDFTVINGENLAGGFGLTSKIYSLLTSQYEIDAITMGNHWKDKRDIYNILNKDHCIVLPANMTCVDHITKGLKVITARKGFKVAVMNIAGSAFMKGENANPLKTADRLLKYLPEYIRIRIVDIHAEASSEKQALAHYLVGRVSLVYGTHSHVPTADEKCLGEWTGYITDVGMTGSYDSVIGIRKEAAINYMLTGNKTRFEPGKSDLCLWAIRVQIDEKTGQCRNIQQLKYPII